VVSISLLRRVVYVLLLLIDIDLFWLANWFVVFFLFPADLLFVFDIDLVFVSVDDCLRLFYDAY
jgi:hypothetical protein